ncbi:uncharacterized protein LOC132612888 [Lycium barbarum]|uniref:uncharacterized protein LOC132612888 n=1 Tax=Lycium barbarum TaxID=112863 RepID=UPI00293E81C3|nr:uncharacterized protein LOC132612888 [Lycium barbarum]
MDEFRDSQKERIQEALDMGELATGRGLNQELDLSRACDTRWGSNYKYFNNFILMYGSIVNVLESLVHDARLMDEIAKAIGYLEACEVAFMLHLMSEVLAITNELNKFLQKKKKQDLANAMLLLEVAKKKKGCRRIGMRNGILLLLRFFDLKGLCDLLKRLVQTKKHSNYPLVFRLVKLALLLPVSTASVERAFSAMKFIKNDLRGQMSGDFFSGCLMP